VRDHTVRVRDARAESRRGLAQDRLIDLQVLDPDTPVADVIFHRMSIVPTEVHVLVHATFSVQPQTQIIAASRELDTHLAQPSRGIYPTVRADIRQIGFRCEVKEAGYREQGIRRAPHWLTLL
jgi:hypothetical protein